MASSAVRWEIVSTCWAERISPSRAIQAVDQYPQSALYCSFISSGIRS